MKKTLMKISSFLLIISILIGSTPLVNAQAQVATITQSGKVSNPVYSSAPKQDESIPSLHSIDLDEYAKNEIEVAQDIRENLEQRKGEFTVKITTSYPIHEDEVHDYFFLAFEETEVSTQGDYLRYCWNTYSYHLEGKHYINTDIYAYDLTYKVKYYTTKEQEDELAREIDNVISSLNLSSDATDRQKIDAIYAYITDNIVYDYENLEDDEYKLKYTAYAALMHKTAVCEGYALLFYRMSKQLGVDARVITGYGGEGRDERHGWNIVKIGNFYYYVDATWDAERFEYAYYLKGSQDFEGHVNDSNFETEEFKEKYPIAPAGLSTGGYDYTEGDFTYHIANNKAVLVKYNGNSRYAIVPSNVNGVPVVHIESHAFYRREIYDTDILETITISEGIESFGFEAIAYCHSLKTINLPSTLDLSHTEQERRSGFTKAPSDNFKLETITVSAASPYLKVVDGVLYTYDMNELLSCPANTDKETFEIPNGVKNIASHAFSDCVNLKSVTMPDSVEFVGYWAFCAAYNLENIRISENAEFFGNYAIYETSITEIHIPASATVILEDAILGEFTKITVDENNPRYSVENGALYDNLTNSIIEYVLDDRKEFSIREGTKHIGNFTFENAVNLEKIMLPEGLIEIGQGAFTNCAALSHLEVPRSVTTIDAVAFSSCKNLVSIIIYENAVELGSTNVDSIFHGTDHVTIYTTEGSEIHEYAANNKLNFTFEPFICHNGHELEYNFVKELPDKIEYNHKCKICGGITAYLYKDRIYLDNTLVNVVLEYNSTPFTGEQLMPAVLSVTYIDGTVLEKGKDYEIDYYNENINAGFGAGEIIFKAKGDYYGGFTKNFDIEWVNLETADVSVTGIDNVKVYDGEHFRQAATVTVNGRRLKLAKNDGTDGDYDLLYSDDGTGPALVIVGYGNYTGIITKPITLNLSAPTNINAAPTSDFGDVVITWDSVERADGYVIYRKIGSGSYEKIAPTEFTSLDVRLSSDKVYYFKVVPFHYVNSVMKESKNSSEICISTKAPTPPTPPTPPAQPALKNLSATSKVTLSLNDGYDDIKASWKKVSGAKGYYVYYKKSSAKSYTLIGKTSGTSAVIKNLSDGVKYTVKVVAYYTQGGKDIVSSKYKTASIYTLKNLSAPKKVTLSLYDYDDVKISWSKVSGASSYKIYYKKGSAKKYTLKKTTTSTSYKFTKLSAGTKYTIKIVPCYKVDGKTYEDDSYKTASVYSLKKLSAPKVSKKSSKSVKVSWTNISGETGYQISASTSKKSTKIVSTYKTTSGKSKTISVKKGKTYYYKVRAYVVVSGKKIYSPWSSTKSYKLK